MANNVFAISDIARRKSFASKDLRPQQQILCKARQNAKLFQFPKTVQDEGFVIKTVPLSLTFPVLVRKPLRLIVARFPITFALHPGYDLTYYLDTLSCGHQVTTHSFESGKKRRGCQECLGALAVPQKAAA